MADDRVAELEKEVRELNLKLEIERQKVRKLEQENQKLKDKMARQARTERPLRVAPGPMSMTGGGSPSDDVVLEGGATEEEVDRLRERLRALTAQKDSSEQEKWDQSKEVIELKENLQRLRVKKINIKKDIEELNERLDRKENQNFKSRLEITDLKKEENRTHAIADDGEADRVSLEAEIVRLTEQADKEKAKLKEEKIARDRVQFAANRAVKIRAEYESHWLAHFYNK
jgi:predicted RNase H-like nuclease (RuvC/YqgF family)